MSIPAKSLLPLALFLTACSSATGPLNTGTKGLGDTEKKPSLEGDSRFFQVMPEDGFWITHDDTRDRLLSGGARLELTPTGQVLAAAWETEKTNLGELLAGGLAVPSQFGGGFIFWSASRVFRSVEFTGPLVPVGLGVPEGTELVVRGMRMGLRGPVILTDAGPREVLAGSNIGVPLTDPGVSDMAALDSLRAIRLDILGRAGWTADGGKTWTDATSAIGPGIRLLAASPEEVWFEAQNGRAVLGSDGPLREPDGQNYRYVDYSRPFQIVWRGTRAERDEGYWYGYRDQQPLHSTILSGVRLADGTALGVLRGAVVKTNLTTGKILSIATDWLPNNIECQPIVLEPPSSPNEKREVLFACSWDDYRGGAYVLRGDGESPPRSERLLTGNGGFVTDDRGGFGYTGSCKAAETYVDPDQYYGRYGSRRYYENETPEYISTPTLCVRRGPDDWVERTLSLDEDTQFVAWIPRKDGSAVALVRGTGRGALLPDSIQNSQRETNQNGVRVVRIFNDVEGYFWTSQQNRPYYGRGAPQQAIIDRRYTVLEDGTVLGWLTPSGGDSSYYAPIKAVGGALRPGGRTEVFELPATPLTMAFGGDYGMFAVRDGHIFETSDRGRTWKAAGITPLIPGSLQGTCSITGCAFSTGARIGWGSPAVVPRITDEKRVEPPRNKSQTWTLKCEPEGLPKAELSTTSPTLATLGSQSKISLTTTFGATLELIRETPDALSSASPYSYPYGRHGYPIPMPSPSATPSAAASAKPGVKSAPVRTHTLVFRPPLDPLAPIVRHNATNASIGYRGRTAATVLLGTGTEVSFLYYGDQNEALVDRNDLVTMPLFDSRRYYYYTDNSLSGLRTANNRALLFGDVRRRASLEEHGTTPQKPPTYFAMERDTNRRRNIGLGRREDGTIGILILDGGTPDTIGVSAFDRIATSIGHMGKLAGWSALTTADDPVCVADKKGYRTLFSIDPTSWFELDKATLPGVTLAKQGIVMVRISEEHLCLEAVDLAVLDPRRRPDYPTGENLVIKWSASKTKTASKDAPNASGVVGALRSLELMQPLSCNIEKPAP